MTVFSLVIGRFLTNYSRSAMILPENERPASRGVGYVGEKKKGGGGASNMCPGAGPMPFYNTAHLYSLSTTFNLILHVLLHILGFEIRPLTTFIRYDS